MNALHTLTTPDHRLNAALSANCVLSHLSRASREQFAAEATWLELAKGALLYRAGETAERVWALVRGEVKITRRTAAGRLLMIELIVPGELCGAFCYSRDETGIFDARAMRESTALGFPVALVEEAAHGNLALIRALAADYCRRLFHAQHMRSIASENVVGRIACALIYLHAKFGLEIPHTRRTVAELAGTSVESAIRATQELARHGLVETSRNRIVIRSLDALEHFAHKT